MHVSKPPKIQNQTKNTKREPELEAPRTDLQIGHVIEAALSRPPSHVALVVFILAQDKSHPSMSNCELSMHSHRILNKLSQNSQ